MVLAGTLSGMGGLGFMFLDEPVVQAGMGYRLERLWDELPGSE